MSVVAAAPHVFDDPLEASPELALVDGDLAAHLREEVRSGIEFRPRPVARPEFRLLHPVLSAAESSLDSEPEEVAVDVEPVVVALETGVPPEATDVDLELADDVGTSAAFPAVALESPVARVSDLPDSVVLLDDTPVATDEQATPEPAIADDTETPSDVADGDPVPEAAAFPDVALEPPLAPVSDLPDYVVVPDETPLESDEPVDREHADAVATPSAFLEVALEPPSASVSELPDYVVGADAGPVATDTPDPALTISDYPVLPDLDEATEVLEETDAALRKIREHLVSEDLLDQAGPHLRRGFVVASVLGAVAALGVFAVDVQLGVVALPGWLGL